MAKPQIEILLVEDDPNDVELALLALQKSSAAGQIEVARDGEEALHYLFHRGPPRAERARAPRLVLLDLKLPKLSGLEVLRAIKSDRRTRPIPVAVLTSSRQDQDMFDCYQLGAHSYIQKPIDFEQFQRAIREVHYYWLTVNQGLPPEVYSLASSGVQQTAS